MDQEWWEVEDNIVAEKERDKLYGDRGEMEGL